MRSDQKGEYAKQKVILRAVDKGYTVSVPTMETRYDLVVDDGKLNKVQVKYADGKAAHTQGSVVVNLVTWNNRGVKRKSRTYTKDEVDYILVYVPKIDKVLRLGPELFEGRMALNIRLEPPKNNQTNGVNLASGMEW